MFNEFFGNLQFDQSITTVSLFQLVLSLVLGGCVGFERKRKGQIAGVRTFALISMGATLAMQLSIYVPYACEQYNIDTGSIFSVKGDATRIAAQIVSGIGFLGAGAIIQMKGSVRGLTTAAGIWTVAAIGMTVGAGRYVIATIATALILIVLVGLERWEHHYHAGVESRIIRLRLHDIVHHIDGYREVLEKHHVHLSNVYVEYDYEVPVTKLNLVVLVRENTNYLQLFKDLSDIRPTEAVSLSNQMSI